MSVTPYVQTACALLDDPDEYARTLTAQALAAHRLACQACLRLMSSAGEGVEAINDVVDAQIDLLIATHGGNVRFALYSALATLGHAQHDGTHK